MNNLPFDVYNQIIQNNKTHALYPTTHSLILYYSGKFKDGYKNANGTKQLLQIMQTNNLNKLKNKRVQWDNLECKIPIEYLDAIGVTENLLTTTIEIDQEIYDNKIKKPVLYSEFTQPIHSIVVKRYQFEEPQTEEDAIELVKQTLINGNIKQYRKQSYCILDRSPYYKVVINHNGKVFYQSNIPDFKIEHHHYVFKMPSFTGIRLK